MSAIACPARILDALEAWVQVPLTRISGKSEMIRAIRRALRRMKTLPVDRKRRVLGRIVDHKINLSDPLPS